MRRGFDTGYFVKYATGELSKTHRQALRDLTDEDGLLGVANGLVIYELKKLGYRGVLEMEDAEWLVKIKLSATRARWIGFSRIRFSRRRRGSPMATTCRWPTP